MSFRWGPRPRRAAASRVVAKASARRTRARRVALEGLEDRALLTIPLNSVTWTPIGPAGINGTGGAGGNGGPASGRIAAIAGDPTNPNTIYAAPAGGGVWKSTDAGASWTPLTDGQKTLFMGSLAVSQSNPKVIYAGTGEANNAGDSFYGYGVLKSADGGATWTLLGNASFNRKAIGKIVVSPTDPNLVYAAVSNAAGGVGGGNGIWKSTDGGTTWTNTTTGPVSGSANDDWSDVVMNPANPSVLYAADGGGSAKAGVYKSTDGGTTWAVAGNLPTGGSTGRIALAIAPANPSEVIASVANAATGGLLYLQKSTDAGATWTNLSAAPDYLGGKNGAGQGWYDNAVAIDPTDPNVMFAAGVVYYGFAHPSPPFVDQYDVVESRDGGTTWTDLTIDSNKNEPHTDSHALAFDASGRLLLGNDGGVWRLNNALPATFSWQDINGNLQVTQFTGAALDPTNADVVYGGSQDNGTEKFTGTTSWNAVFGGDGGFVAVDPSNPQTVYTENFGISLERSTDGGASFNQVISGINLKDPVNFYAQYTIDPSNPSHLLYGTNVLYTTTNKGNSWTALTATGQSGWSNNANDPVEWTSISPADPKTIYSVTDGGNIFVSTDAGATWAQRNVAGGGPFGQLLADPNNAQTAYIVKAGFGGGHVFKTVNGGQNWTDISGTLPNIPVDSIAVDNRAAVHRIYAGTDQGVWASSDGGATWAPFKTGMPNAQVVTLELNPTLNVLMAATHGRGVFEIQAIDSIGVLPSVLSGVVEATDLAAGSPSGMVQVAKFNDAPALLATGSYTATINWGDGSPTSTGVIVDLGNGFYGVLGDHTYAEEGSYPLSIGVTNAGNGHSGAASTQLTVGDAPLTGQGQALSPSPTEGAAFNGQVGTFTDANPNAPLSDFTATINWGDGTTSSGTVTALGGGRFSVSGTNAYKVFGSYNVTTTVADVGGATTKLNSTVSVQDAPLTSTAKTFTGVEGTAFTTAVASFTDADPNAQVGYFGATVDWGDGTTSNLTSGVSIVSQATRFDVVARHQYARFGTYTVKVSVNDMGVTGTTAVSTAAISDAPFTAQAAGFTTTEGATFTGPVATIVDTNPGAVASDYTAGTLINWGDGTPATPATGIVSLGNGRLQVMGSHQYNKYGTYPVSVQVVAASGSTASASGNATVLDAPISVQGVPNFKGEAGLPVTGTVATFTSSFAGAPLSDFTATIDWGDGTATDQGTVTGSNGSFAVAGNHTYARAQTYPVTVSVVSAGGSKGTGTTSIVVADAPVNVSPAVIPPLTQGAPFVGVVATFDTADPATGSTGNALALPSDFVASIDWGDGSSTGAVVTQLGGGKFTVSGDASHVYDNPGTYPVKVLVISLGGNRGSASTSVDVSEAPIVGVPGAPILAVAGTPFSGQVGTFTQYAKTPAGSFTATINWGDGTPPTTGTVAATANGTFTVSAGHTYTTYGSYKPTVTVKDVAGTTGSFVVQAAVADAALSGTGTPVSSVQGLPFGGTVATFTDANTFARASDFRVAINWGDGTPVDHTGFVIGSAGQFSVEGVHTYAKPGAAYPISVTVTDTAGGPGGSVVSPTTSAHVLTPLSGVMSRASDSGVSILDGITNVNAPVFSGRAEPGSTVNVVAYSAASPSGAAVGTTTANALGNWAVTISPLADGAYVMFASMSTAGSATPVQTTPLAVSAYGSPVLVVDTTAPTVAGVALNPANGVLTVVLQDGLSGLSPAGLVNPANFSLATPNGLGLTPIAPRGLTVAVAGPGQIAVGVAFGPRPGGTYVVTLNALGITDMAGNTLVEKNFVAFPQTTNFPNPNYIAEIDVANGRAAAPKPYVSIPEQVAAYNFSNATNTRTTVRLPRGRVRAAAVPQPSSFRRNG